MHLVPRPRWRHASVSCPVLSWRKKLLLRGLVEDSASTAFEDSGVEGEVQVFDRGATRGDRLLGRFVWRRRHTWPLLPCSQPYGVIWTRLMKELNLQESLKFGDVD